MRGEERREEREKYRQILIDGQRNRSKKTDIRTRLGEGNCFLAIWCKVNGPVVVKTDLTFLRFSDDYQFAERKTSGGGVVKKGEA